MDGMAPLPSSNLASNTRAPARASRHSPPLRGLHNRAHSNISLLPYNSIWSWSGKARLPLENPSPGAPPFCLTVHRKGQCHTVALPPSRVRTSHMPQPHPVLHSPSRARRIAKRQKSLHIQCQVGFLNRSVTQISQACVPPVMPFTKAAGQSGPRCRCRAHARQPQTHGRASAEQLTNVSIQFRNRPDGPFGSMPGRPDITP
jgi:hypothetical protein